MKIILATHTPLHHQFSARVYIIEFQMGGMLNLLQVDKRA